MTLQEAATDYKMDLDICYVPDDEMWYWRISYFDESDSYSIIESKEGFHSTEYCKIDLIDYLSTFKL